VTNHTEWVHVGGLGHEGDNDYCHFTNHSSQHTYTVKTKYLDLSASEVPDSLLITTGLPQLLKDTANTQGCDSDEGWVAKK